MKTSFSAYLAFKCLKIGPENGLKIHIDLKGDGDFYFKGRIFIMILINPESMNPRLPCDLYEPWSCIFHPLTSMGILAHPECSGLPVKCPYRVNLTLQ